MAVPYCKGSTILTTMYLLAYFRTAAEALHYALSEDGLVWHALNGNRPVLLGEVGSKTLRDPFVFRALDGHYHLCVSGPGWALSPVGDGWLGVPSDCPCHLKRPSEVVAANVNPTDGWWSTRA